MYTLIAATIAGTNGERNRDLVVVPLTTVLCHLGNATPDTFR